MTRDRTNDDLCTPRWILDLVRGVVGTITLDPCSNQWSGVSAHIAISLEECRDGLAQRWIELAPNAPAEWSPSYIGVPSVFWNPPYSKPGPWVKRAIESKADGMESIGLLKHDPSTKWSAALRPHLNARCDLSRRVAFEGGAHGAGKMASTVVYMGPRPYLFAHVFAPHGEIRVFDDSPYSRGAT